MTRHALSQLEMPGEEVHVWCAKLDQPAEEVADLYDLLSTDERERAGRFHCLKARGEFTIARGLLRSLLGAYLDVDPRHIRFATGPAGKPELREPRSPLQFNITHSRGLGLFAVTERSPIGVDVECLRAMPSYLGMAERYFSPWEYDVLRELPDEHRIRGFFHAWTRKEAYLKATGVGISYGLERVEVTLRPDEPPRIVRLDGEEHKANGWSLTHLNPAPGFVGAVVVEGHDYRLVVRRFPET